MSLVAEDESTRSGVGTTASTVVGLTNPTQVLDDKSDLAVEYVLYEFGTPERGRGGKYRM